MTAKTPVIAIFDVGKTNKKVFLFDQQYRIVYEKSARFSEITDEDGFACENLQALRKSLLDTLGDLATSKQFDLRAVNISAYGASLIGIDDAGTAVTPLYNYLKPYPPALEESFYQQYGPAADFACRTASPRLGSLNSGLQLYRIKLEQPHVFERIRFALHLPQYLSFLLTGEAVSDLTSIGCHTALWDFRKSQYAEWINSEGIGNKMAPVKPGSQTFTILFKDKRLEAGPGLHDSSAALIPYLLNFTEPFLLLSTGTWCISLNPFNKNPLTETELANDCLFYLDYQGNPVKAARQFLGFYHEKAIHKIAKHFSLDSLDLHNLPFDLQLYHRVKKESCSEPDRDIAEPFDPGLFSTGIEAYYGLIYELVRIEEKSIRLVSEGSAVKRIFVDGGFSGNKIFMNILAHQLPIFEVFAASMAQASALGAALAIHSSWNTEAIPSNLIGLEYFNAKKET